MSNLKENPSHIVALVANRCQELYCLHKLNLGLPVTIAMDGMVSFIFLHSYNTIHSLTWLSSILPQNYPMVFFLLPPLNRAFPQRQHGLECDWWRRAVHL